MSYNRKSGRRLNKLGVYHFFIDLNIIIDLAIFLP